jgi:pilus assembly protein CpaF
MFEVVLQDASGKKHKFTGANGSCRIGSGRDNDIIMKSKQVSKRHAIIEFDKSGCHIEDMGSMSGTWVNRDRIVSYGPIHHMDEIVIGEYKLWVFEANAKAESSNTATPKPTNPASVKQAVAEPAGASPAVPQQTDKVSAKPAADDGSPSPQTEEMKERIKEMMHWREFIHDKIIDFMDLRRKDVHNMSDTQLRNETEALISEILEQFDQEIPSHIDRKILHDDVLNEAVGLGPLERLLADDSVTEIMVNASDQIFVEQGGRLTLSDCTFTNDPAVLAVIERIITPLGRRIDESSPLVDARLKDGSRVNAIIPPLALKGPCITIRKFAKNRLYFEDLMNFGSISKEMVEFLNVCVKYKRNIVVSGGTGSGKTTLLNVLSNLIPKTERIVTCEDAAELQLNQPNLVALESRPANLEGRGAVLIRDLVKNALRMRPDRIVVGECRGGEALDMLQAMNTGHDGSLTTAHANSPRDILSRLEVMVLMAGMDLPITAIREQLASAVNLIVQQTRFPCGSRKVTYVTEVVGMESGIIQLQDIFVFKQQGIDENGKVRGRFQACGFIPSFYEELKKIGIDVDLTIFQPPEDDE